MDKLHIFDNCEQNYETYGGISGFKIGVKYNEDNYLLKFAGKLKQHGFKDAEISYSNSPVSEYIGSHIYELLDIPVHETLLGTRKGKIVVACKDFRKPGEELIEFSKIRITTDPEKAGHYETDTNGVGMELTAVLSTINTHPILQQIPGVSERFCQIV